MLSIRSVLAKLVFGVHLLKCVKLVMKIGVILNALVDNVLCMKRGGIEPTELSNYK